MRHNPASGIMAKFVRYGRIIVIAGVEIGKLGHDHMIAARLIIGLRSEVFKGDGDASEKRVQLGIPLIGIGCGDDRRGGWIFRLDAIDLLGIENGIALKKRHLTLAVLAALSTLVGVNLDLVGIDDGRTLLALADASTKRKR